LTRSRSRKVTALTIIILLSLSILFYSVYQYTLHVRIPNTPDIWVFEGTGDHDGLFLSIALNNTGKPIEHIRFEFNFFGSYNAIISSYTSSSGIAYLNTSEFFQHLGESCDITVYEGSSVILSAQNILLASASLILSYADTSGTWGAIISGTNYTVPIGVSEVVAVCPPFNLSGGTNYSLYMTMSVNGSRASPVFLGDIACPYQIFKINVQRATYDFQIFLSGNLVSSTYITNSKKDAPLSE